MVSDDGAGLETRYQLLCQQVEALSAQTGKHQHRIAELMAENTRLRDENTRLRVALLVAQQRQDQDSSNSSRPPSSDGFKTGKPVRQRSLRPRSDRDPGGQPGHPGTTLYQVSDPDRVVDIYPMVCRACGEGLPAGVDDGKTVVRQVFDVPVPRVEVTEYRLHKTRCGACGKKTTAPAPAGVVAPVQYGPSVAAAVVYQHEAQVVSRDRTAEAVKALVGAGVSTGTVSNMQARTATRLEEFTSQVAGQLVGAAVVGADETGVKAAGKLGWIHVARDESRTLLGFHPRRGHQGMEELGVIAGFTGTLVHDALRSYDCFDNVGAHQLCGAHLLRELQAVTDYYQRYGVDPGCGVGEWVWSVQAGDALMAIKTATDQALDKVCPPEILAQQKRLLNWAAVVTLRSEWVAPPGVVGAKHQALARRIHQRLDDYLRFATTPGVPFDNNGSERDLRMAKLRMKVSGCFRSIDGARRYAAIRSYLSTCAKNSRDLLAALADAYQHKPFIPAAGVT